MDTEQTRGSQGVDETLEDYRPRTLARMDALRTRQFNTDRPPVISLELDIVVLGADRGSGRDPDQSMDAGSQAAAA